ncbi:MAG TPA: DUF3037 domain-containing protein [Jiangellaceae bacterium]
MKAFSYALLRAVPRIERGECVNVGVILYCQADAFLAARVHVDVDRLLALDASADVTAVRDAANAIAATCTDDGLAGGASLGERFRWLTSPRSTIVQPGPTHAGLTDDPAADLDRIFADLVR